MNEIREIGTGSPCPATSPAGASYEQRREGCASILLDGGASAPPIYDIEDVIGYDALWDSMEKCRKGVAWKGSVQSFLLNAPVQIDKLCDQLHSGTYVPKAPKHFVITSPKRREIVGIAFRDRIVQRSYNDNVIYPCMSRSWIYDNYACQKGKGTDFARNRMRAHLERQARLNGPDFYVLVIDVRGYYDNLLYEVMGERFYSTCPRWAASFACDVIQNQYGYGERGVNPGSQLVQISGVDYLSHIDHFVKEELRVRGYGRYMDDLVFVHSDLGFLVECRDEVARRMSWVGLEQHPKKTRVVRAADGFRFLGFDWRVASDGAVVQTLKTENVKAMRRRIRRLWNLERSGERPDGTTDTAYAGWRAHACKGDGWRVLESNDNWYLNLTGRT